MFKKINILIFILICSSFSLFSFHKLWNKIDPPKHLIIDTDVDIDDMMAILFLLNTPDVKVEAITTSGVGMAKWPYSAPNILKLLQLAAHPSIPVSYGAKESLSPYSDFPEKWREEIDRVYGIPLPNNPNPPSSLTSSELIIKIANESKDKIDILCLGPLTNIAIAIMHDPTLKKKIRRIYISGGAIFVRGNIVGEAHGYINHFAEYNILLDAKAASIVIKSGIPVTLIPLDATENAPITKQFYNKLKRDKTTPSAQFVYDLTKPYIDLQKNLEVYYWDPAAAYVMTHPHAGRYETLPIEIVQQVGDQYGRTKVSHENGTRIKICTWMDGKTFYRSFLKTLNDDKDE